MHHENRGFMIEMGSPHRPNKTNVIHTLRQMRDSVRNLYSGSTMLGEFEGRRQQPTGGTHGFHVIEKSLGNLAGVLPKGRLWVE
jgi:hypothetical protein